MNKRAVLRPYGPHAVLAEFVDLDSVIRATATLRADPLAGVIDVVPAARTLLVTFEQLDLDLLAARLSEPGDVIALAAESVDVTVDYDGPDLAEVAERCGFTVDDVIARHTGASYTVAFCGFMPGFSYLVGLDPRLRLPRRADPRPRVPAGAVAIASEFTAIYPNESPGGWHLIGRTDVALWDETRAVPALLAPGTRVRFAAR